MALTINGETIPPEILHEEFQNIKAHYERMARVSCCERDPEFRQYARDNITARVLLNQEAERRYPEIAEEEILEGVERLMTEHGGREAFFANTGLTPDTEHLVREDVKAGLRVDRLMREAWGEETGAPSEEQQQWYEEHLGEFMTAEEIRASHLFKHVEKSEDRERLYEFLRGIRSRVRAGEDFEVLALEHTDKEDKLVDLGWFKRGDYMEEFDLIVFSLSEGEVSPVFASHWGFHLAKITGHRVPRPRPFAEVQAEVVERMRHEQRQQATRGLVDRLKVVAKIESADD
jgi:parvulin-like peptidyl-prolyl isomerase